MMNCKEVQDLLSAYIDNECTQEEQDAIKSHLEQCAECNETFVFMKALIEQTHNLDELEVPDGFHEDLMHRINKIHHDSSINKPLSKLNHPRYSVVAAAFLLLVIFSLFGTQQLLKMSNRDYGLKSESVVQDQTLENEMQINSQDNQSAVENNMSVQSKIAVDENITNPEEESSNQPAALMIPDESTRAYVSGDAAADTAVPPSDEIISSKLADGTNNLPNDQIALKSIVETDNEKAKNSQEQSDFAALALLIFIPLSILLYLITKRYFLK